MSKSYKAAFAAASLASAILIPATATTAIGASVTDVPAAKAAATSIEAPIVLALSLSQGNSGSRDDGRGGKSEQADRDRKSKVR